MNSIHESWYKQHLSCPDCGSDLTIDPDKIICLSCSYVTALSTTVKIKPKNPSPLPTKLPRIMAKHPVDILSQTDLSRPNINYDGPSAIRDSGELFSEIKSYLGNSGTLLDLGCGPKDQEAPAHHIGYQYVGIDYSNKNADILADAHSIPFKNETFDCVLSYAVLEHLHNPFVAVSEIERILKPGGVYVGTVSQGEPFHDSFFHHTAWGFVSLLSSVTTLQPKRIWWSGDTLASLSRMGRYPRIIKKLLMAVDTVHIGAPWLAPRKMKWPENERQLDHIYRAGSICFVAQKP